MSAPTIAIIDGGGANIASLRFALTRLGHDSVLTTDERAIRAADRVILPGVGAAADAMQRLRAARLHEVIPTLTQPVLGICLGLQLMFDASDEDDTRCLGLMRGTARLLPSSPERSVPHMGWNQIQAHGESALLTGIPDGTHFYFVHSYALDVSEDTSAMASYGEAFTAVAQRGNFMATQFHPERSGEHGARLLDNFLAGTAS